MKKYFWLLFCGILFVPAFAPAPGQAQNTLPPGTQMPSSPSPVISGTGLDEAEEKIQQQNLGGARPLVENYLSAHPHDARALFDLGYIDQSANHGDAAMKDYREAIAADPKQFESRLALGLMLAQQGSTDAARTQLEQATALTPSSPNPGAQAQAFRALAALDRTSDPGSAKIALLSALRLTPETPQDLLLTAQIAEASGDEETAQTAYRRVLERQPQSSLASQATAGLVHLLLKDQKYSDAEALLKSSLEKDPDNPALNAQLATTLIALRKNDEALPVLEKLRKLQPDDSSPESASVEEMLADAYSQAGDPGKADPIYAKIALARPLDADVLVAQGNNLTREQHYIQAQQVFERAVKLKPDNGDAWSGLAFAASENKQYSTTLQALTMRAKYLPETSGSYFLWATSYDNLHQSRLAEDYYRKFLTAAGGKFPDQEWQARQRLAVLGRSR